MFDAKLLDVATKLLDHCRNGTESDGLKTLYAADCVSIEAASPGGGDVTARGIDAIKGKHDWWNNAHTVHAGSVEGPFIHGADRFGLIFSMDVTDKESKRRMQMKELAIYTVAQGKIVREEFFYSAS
ncbi:MAG: hypothetical protein K2Q06_16690 [Parvularculaceae bacterium]|nr:hypothetical protein [Parvularculaceae bacterium]